MTSPEARSLRTLWLVFTIGGAVLLVAAGALAASTPAGRGGAELLFYLNALANVGAIAGAFALQRRLDLRLPGASSREKAASLIRVHALGSLGLLAASLTLGAALAFFTGNVINLAFGAPFFAFARLFWPSDARYAGWLARADARV